MRELKRGVWWTVISVLLLASVSGLVYWDYTTYMESPVSTKELKQTKVVIPRDSTLSDVVDILSDKGLIRNPNYFRIHLLVSDQAGALKAGAYYFHTSQSPEEMALMLSEGPKTPFIILTIKEGYNIWQVASAVEDAGIATTSQVMDLINDPAFAKKTGVPVGISADKVVSKLEGFLFPETYYIAPGQDLDSIFSRIVRQAFLELKAAKKKHLAQYSALLEEVGMSDHDLVTLASLVERETALPHEKKLVASVFLNRLKKGMPLQTDPTLTYSEEKRGRRPTSEDRKDESNPYNTYVHKGLPPGPICNPGRKSLAASVAPAGTEFLFFVAKQDGTGGHHFTTNYKDHKRAVRKYLKKGRK